MKCEVCGTKQHHCTSCCGGEWYDASLYCSEKCARQSEYYLKVKADIVDLLDGLSLKQRMILYRLLCEELNDTIVDIIENEMNGKEGVEAWGLW